MGMIEELQRRAKREYGNHKARLREHYSYARSLGFTPSQAKIMSGWSIERIQQVFPPNKKEAKN